MRETGILTDDMKRMLGEQRLVFAATVCRDGTPNLSPKGTAMAWDDDHLVFAHLYSPQTVENLRHNPGIEINVVDVVTRKGYRFKGRGEVLAQGELYESIMAMYRGDTGHDPLRDPDRRIQALVLITVDRAAPLISPAYDDGATEEEVVVEWEQYWDMLRTTRQATKQS